jgi:hypothetical protein
MFPLSHEMLATCVALGVEVLLFILIPIYLHTRWRHEIQNRIRVIYDSRRPEYYRTANVLPFSRKHPRHASNSFRKRVA